MNSKTSKNIKIIAIVALVMSAVLLLTSCGFALPFQAQEKAQETNGDDNEFVELDPPKKKTETETQSESEAESGIPESTEKNDETEKVTETEKSDDTEQTVVESNSVVNNNTINITGNSDLKYATAKGLRSAVSIYCAFTQTVIGGTYWEPTTQTQEYYSTGSGVFYKLENDGSAFVVTNFHVVYSGNSNESDHISQKISLFLYGMEKAEYAISATFVGGSAEYDIAVLRVDKSQILKDAVDAGSVAEVTLGNSDLVVPGEDTIAIGNPSTTTISGLSVTKGIVSVDSEYITMAPIDESGDPITCRVIRTDTPVNSGNSGGGLFNSKGEWIGVVNAKSTISNVDNIGYAIPSNVARAISDNVIYNCYVNNLDCVYKGFLGVQVIVSKYYSEYDETQGIIIKKEEITIEEIDAGQFADGFLQVGDVFKSVTVGGKTIEIYRKHHLSDILFDFRVGETVTFKVVRGGTEMTLNKVVEESNFIEC